MSEKDKTPETIANRTLSEIQAIEKTWPLICKAVASLARRHPVLTGILAVAIVVLGWHYFFGLRAQVTNLTTKLQNTKAELQTTKNELNRVNLELTPFKTAALVVYGKDDSETLTKLANNIETLRAAYSNAQEKVRALEAEIDRVRGQTERAVSPEKGEKLVSYFKTLPKAKVAIKRYDLTAESERFSKQLETIFSQSGFELKVHPVEVGSLNLVHLVGQRFQVNTTNQPDCAKRMFDAFNSAGIGFEPALFPNLNSDEIEIAIFRLSK